MVDAAVAAARRALAGEWGCWPLAKRVAILHKIADGIEARFQDFLRRKSRTQANHVRSRRALTSRAAPQIFARLPTLSRPRALNRFARKLPMASSR